MTPPSSTFAAPYWKPYWALVTGSLTDTVTRPYFSGVMLGNGHPYSNPYPPEGVRESKGVTNGSEKGCPEAGATLSLARPELPPSREDERGRAIARASVAGTHPHVRAQRDAFPWRERACRTFGVYGVLVGLAVVAFVAALALAVGATGDASSVTGVTRVTSRREATGEANGKQTPKQNGRAIRLLAALSPMDREVAGAHRPVARHVVAVSASPHRVRTPIPTAALPAEIPARASTSRGGFDGEVSATGALMTDRRGPSILRTAHGTGADALLRAETPSLDELASLNAEDTARGLAKAQATGRPFTPGNRAAANRKPDACRLGIPIDTADPRWGRTLRKAKRYTDRRIRDLTVEHGGEIGAGVCAMLASSGLALAASRLLYELAGETMNATMFVQAARLSETSRQQELTATALAAREGHARRAARRSGTLDILQPDDADDAVGTPVEASAPEADEEPTS